MQTAGAGGGRAARTPVSLTAPVPRLAPRSSLLPLLLLLLLTHAVHAIPFNVHDITISGTITVGSAVDNVTMERVLLVNGASVVLDVSAMQPGAVTVSLRDCECSGGSQIYVLGYRSGALPDDRQLTVDVVGMRATSCSLVVAYRLPDGATVTVANSTLATNGLIAFPAVSELSSSGEATAPALVLYGVSLTNGGSVRVMNTTLSSGVAGGMAVYIGGTVSLEGGALVFDAVQMVAPVGAASYALYTSPLGSLSLSQGSLLSVTESTLLAGGRGLSLGSNLLLSASVVRVMRVRGSMPQAVLEAGGTVVTGGWLLLHSVTAGQQSSRVAMLASLTVSDGRVSVVRCAASGPALATGLGQGSSGLVGVQCNRANGQSLSTVSSYQAAGLTVATVIGCDTCAESVSCYAPLTTSFGECECGCATGGMGPQCLPQSAPTPDVGAGGIAPCVKDTTVTMSMTVGTGYSGVCFDSVVFSGETTAVTIDVASMDPFADVLSVTLTNCTMESGAMLTILGTQDSTDLLPPSSVHIVGMLALDGTIVFRDALPTRSSVLVDNSTLYSTSAKSQYRATTSLWATSRFGPALALIGVRLVEAEFVVTRTTMRCSEVMTSPCAVIVVEYDLVVNKSSRLYLDNVAVRSNYRCMTFLSCSLRVDGGSVVSFQNGTWTGSVSDYTIDMAQMSVKQGSVLMFTGNQLHAPLVLLLTSSSMDIEDGSWFVFSQNKLYSFLGLYVYYLNLKSSSVFSLFDNKLVPSAVSGASMFLLFILYAQNIDSGSGIYGGCNYLGGNLVNEYSTIGITSPKAVYACGSCSQAKTAVCFDSLTSSYSGCACACQSRGNGALCLPAAIPPDLGPKEDLTQPPGDPVCVTDKEVSSVTLLATASGACFINVIFTAMTTFQLSQLSPLSKVYNLTFERCTFKATISITGDDAVPTRLRIDEGVMTTGYVSLSGNFADESMLAFTNTKIATATSYAMYIGSGFKLGSGSTLRMQNMTIILSYTYPYGIYIAADLTLNNASIIFDSNLIKFPNAQNIAYSPIRLGMGLQLQEGSSLVVTGNSATAGSLVYFSYGISRLSGLVLIANNTLSSPNVQGCMIYMNGNTFIYDPGQLRVMDNTMSRATIFLLSIAFYSIFFGQSEPVLIFSGNTVTDTNAVAINIAPTSFGVNSNSTQIIIVGCNTQGGEEIEYDNFPEEITTIACDTCDQTLACYGPGTESFSSGACGCTCVAGVGFGRNCYPYSIPYLPPMVEPVVPLPPVDESTDCISSTLMTDMSDLDLWKTTHCFVGVTFIESVAGIKFEFAKMPLHLPINITFVNCTFVNGATVTFLGAVAPIASNQLTITMSKLNMQNGCVAFSQALPIGTIFSMTEVTGTQSSSVLVPVGTFFAASQYSVLLFYAATMNNCTILISNIEVTAMSGSASSSLIYHYSGTMAISNSTAFHIRYSRPTGFTRLVYFASIWIVSDRSVLSVNNNTLIGGLVMVHLNYHMQVTGTSALRIIGNIGETLTTAGIYSYGNLQAVSSSWIDIRGNSFPQAPLLYYMGSLYDRSIDATSVVTITDNEAGLIVSPFAIAIFVTTPGYQLVMGCLVIDELDVITAANLSDNGVTEQSRVAPCGECAVDVKCFQPLAQEETTGCPCECAGGYGDVCLPAPVPEGPPPLPPPPPPPPTPPPPSPPPAGECIEGMVFPQRSINYGTGVSWLCFRNVTFTGPSTVLSVSVARLAEGAVEIIFDQCQWSSGALLDIIGGSNPTLTALSISIVDSTHRSSGISLRGSFPPNTNITVARTTLDVTGTFSQGGTSILSTNPIASYGGLTLDRSVFVVSGCRFTGSVSGGYGLYVDTFGITLKSQSLFAQLGNVIERTTMGLCQVGGSITMDSNSTISLTGTVATAVRGGYLLYLSGNLYSYRGSVLLAEKNTMNAATMLYFWTYLNLESNSYMHIADNVLQTIDSYGVVVFAYYGITGSDSVAVMANNVAIYVATPTSPKSISGGIFRAVFFAGEFTESTIVQKCNQLNDAPAEYPLIGSQSGMEISDCDAACTLEEQCTPAYTESLSASDCTCTCTSEGYGAMCTPVDIPPAPELDTNADAACISDIWISTKTSPALSSTVMCYIGVTFRADVTVSLGVMADRPLNVTFVDCVFSAGANLYVASTVRQNNQLTLTVRGATFQDGSALVVANALPAASSVMVLDSKFVSTVSPMYSVAYNTAPAACILFFNVSLSGGTVVTVARTDVTAVFDRAIAVAFYGNVKATGRSAVYLDGVSVETQVDDGITFEGGTVSISENSVIGVLQSSFLLCTRAVHVSSALEVSQNSGFEVSGGTFARLSDYAVYVDGPAATFSGGGRLLLRENMCDGARGLLAVASATVTTLSSGAWSLAANDVSASQLVQVAVDSGTALVRVACNRAAGSTLATLADYGTAGFSDTSVLALTACDTCDKDTYCHGPGTASASSASGRCTCACVAGSGFGDACFGVAPAALPPPVASIVKPFVLENKVVDTELLIPHRLRSVVLRNLLIDTVQVKLYVPWMAVGTVSVVIENVKLQRGAVLYVLGGTGQPESGKSLELYMCGVTTMNGAVVLAGSFPEDSVVTLTDSNFLMVATVELPYLSGTQMTTYAPGIVLSGISMKRSVLIMHGVQMLCVVGSCRAVAAEGTPAALSLDASGMALDSFVFGASYAVHVGGPVALTGGSVLRLSDSELYGGRGVVLAQGISAADSVVMVDGNRASLSAGPLLTVAVRAMFPASWLSIRDIECTGGQTVVSFPTGANGLNADGGTFSLYNVRADGTRVVEGSVVVGGVAVEYVAGCLYRGSVQLLPFEYSSVGVTVPSGNTIGCGVCDERVRCFAALTTSLDAPRCRCRCAEGGRGPECLPLYLGTPNACGGVPPEPTPTPTPITPSSEQSSGPPVPPGTPTVTSDPWPWPPEPPQTSTQEVSESSSKSRSGSSSGPAPPEETSTSSRGGEITDDRSSSHPPVTETETEVTGSNAGPCPLLAARVSGTAGSKLTQNDIRDVASANALVLSIELPEGYEWSASATLSSRFSYVLLSAPQAAGYAGPWGELVRAAQWRRSAARPSTVMELTLPRIADYYVTVDERLLVSVTGGAVAGGCVGSAKGSLIVASSTAPASQNALYGINTAVATVTAAVVLFTGGLGSILEIQTLGVFAQMSCASAYERDTAVALPYFLSFFAHHGPLWMMVGNACIAIAFGLLHYAAVLVVRHVRKLSLEDAFATVLFPSLTYLVAYLMHLGIFVSSAFMLALPSPKGQHYALGVVGVLYGVAFPFGVYYVLTRHAALNFVKYWQFSKKPFYVRWLYPIGYWNPPARQRMYGSAITNMKGRYMLWCVFPLVVLCVVGIIAAVRPPEDQCHVPYFCMAAVLLAAAVVVAATNMMRSGFLTAMQTASFVLLAVLCVINAANSLTPSKAGLNAYTTFELLLMVLLLGSAVYSFAIGFAEIRYWQTLREPKKGNLETLLNAEGYSDADGVESSRQEDDSVMDGKPLHLLRDDEDEDYQDEGENAEEGVEGEEEAVDPLADVGEQEPEDSGADLLAGDELAVIADDSAAPEDLDEDML